MSRRTRGGVRSPKIQGKGQTFTRYLYATDGGAATEVDSAASIQLPTDCFLVGVQHQLVPVVSATGDAFISEISSSGNYQGISNDNSNSIHVLATVGRETGTGIMHLNISDSISGMRIPFAAGERIHLNFGHTASKTMTAYAVLHFEQR